MVVVVNGRAEAFIGLAADCTALVEPSPAAGHGKRPYATSMVP